MKSGLWVVDTNVVVAGLLSADGPPAQILDAMLAGRMRFLLSVELLSEYRTVLLRKTIRKRHSLSPQDVDFILEALATHAAVADIRTRQETAPDPGDNHLWQLLAARPEAGLITGDKLLLAHPPSKTRILTPSEWHITSK